MKARSLVQQLAPGTVLVLLEPGREWAEPVSMVASFAVQYHSRDSGSCPGAHLCIDARLCPVLRATCARQAELGRQV